MSFEASILIIEDDEPLRESFRDILRRRNFKVTEAGGIQEGHHRIKNEDFDIILLDISLPDGNGLDFLKIIAPQFRNRIIMISAHGTIENAVAATKKGAYDFLVKPVVRDRLLATIRKALEVNENLDNYQQLKDELSNNSTLEKIIFKSKKMRQVLQKALEAAKSSSTILISGETGTGKELMAHALHNSSARANKPFITVNCAAIPEHLAESELFGFEKGAFTGADKAYAGKFMMANHGSIFLDEVGELSENIQSKLLRVLESGEISPLKSTKPKNIDVRILAASNRNLESYTKEGHFRLDLFYRIEQIKITIPPLRERVTDIMPLSRHFLHLANIKFSKNIRNISKEAEQLLLEYPWPGNVRELKNTISEIALFVSSPEILPEHLPTKILNLQQNEFIPNEKLLSLKEVERQQIEKTLRLTGFNIQRTARILGITRPSLYAKMEKYNIQRNS